MIQIKNRYTGEVIRTVGAETLSGADLRNADLRNADLRNADLSDADLSDADLRGADLRGAYLSGATLPTGETWETYCTEVVPALLAAGGHPVACDAWRCHDWTNCLVASAFGVDGITKVPALYRPRAEQLIQFFDAHLLNHLAPAAPEQTPAEQALTAEDKAAYAARGMLGPGLIDGGDPFEPGAW
jgi:hypothetical protein